MTKSKGKFVSILNLTRGKVKTKCLFYRQTICLMIMRPG